MAEFFQIGNGYAVNAGTVKFIARNNEAIVIKFCDGEEKRVQFDTEEAAESVISSLWGDDSNDE